MMASMVRRDARHGIAALLVLSAAGLTAACIDGPSGPSGNGFGTLRINPVLEPGGNPQDLGLDRIHIRVERHGSGAAVVDTILPYEVASSRTYDWVIELEAPPDSMAVEARVFADTASMYAGGRVVALPETPAGEGAVRDVLLDYVGGGAGADRIAIAPRDSVIMFGDSVQYRAVGTDAQNQPVPGVVVSWSTSNVQVASISSTGLLRAPLQRATLNVKATTPTGLVDSTTVTFIPVPTLVEALEGDGDTSRVAETIPVAVQVLAADGLGVKGIPVIWNAPPGASVLDSVVITDDLGIARTMGTLGTVAGDYTFEAIVLTLPRVQLTAVALPGPPARLDFIVQPTSAGVNQVIAPAVEVAVSDAFGNRAAAPSTTVTLTLETNPVSGQLLGATTIATVNGTAVFQDLRIDAAGSGYSLRAEAQGLPAVVSDPFDVATEVATVDVAPASVTLTAYGQTQQLTATARDANGAPISGVTFTWASSDTSIATVDDQGVVQAIDNGASPSRRPQARSATPP